jgi:hypothetical protein
VLDVLLLVQRREVDDAAVRAACERIFGERAGHAWPISSFAFPTAWHGILAELAREVHYDTDDTSVIELRFNSYLMSLTESG